MKVVFMYLKRLLLISSTLLITSSGFPFDNDKIARLQFADVPVKNSLKEKVPYLLHGANPQLKLTERNLFTLIFSPEEHTYRNFSRITGISIFNAKFTVSWYVFTNSSQIPDSTRKTLELLNTEKPLIFSSINYINGKWSAIADLPYYANLEDVFIYAYVAFPNMAGVLVPLAGQSFYRDRVVGDAKRIQKATLSGDILQFWDQEGYF